MNVTPEELAAYADGELGPARAAEVSAAVHADSALARQLDAHRTLRDRLGAHFAPVLEQPVPEQLTAMLRPSPSSIASLTDARERRDRARSLPRWTWFAGPALAASLALAVFLPRGGDGYVGGTLADALERQLVATQDQSATTRILLSFRDGTGAYCRAFAGEAQSGIACRDTEGWRMVLDGEGAPAQQGDYRMAGNPAAEVLERAQAMAVGPALDAAQEETARAAGWR
jgi:hypothetical protein